MRKQLLFGLYSLAVALIVGTSLTVGAGQVAAMAPTQALAGGAAAINTVAATSGTASERFKQSWSWYISRASGILAAVLLVVLIISGIGLLTGYTYKVLEPLPAWAAHRAVGIAFTVSVLIHIFILLFDKFIGFKLADVLVPFYSDYKPQTLGGLELGAIAMAFGVLALYAIIAVVVSSLLWMQKHPKPWRLLHYLSYVILFFVFIHGLMLGTDLKHMWAKALWFGGAVILLVSIASRLRRANTVRKDS